MIDVIDEITWELNQITQKISKMYYLPDCLAEDLNRQVIRLQEVFNEFCYLEEQQN